MTKLKITGNPHSYKIELDGKDISKYISSLSLDMVAPEPARVIIELQALELDIDIAELHYLLQAREQYQNKIKAHNRVKK